MTKREFYSDIIELVNTYGTYIGYHKKSKNLFPCLMITCKNCAFYHEDEDCQKYAEAWLDKEMRWDR